MASGLWKRAARELLELCAVGPRVERGHPLGYAKQRKIEWQGQEHPGPQGSRPDATDHRLPITVIDLQRRSPTLAFSDVHRSDLIPRDQTEKATLQTGR